MTPSGPAAVGLVQLLITDGGVHVLLQVGFIANLRAIKSHTIVEQV